MKKIHREIFRCLGWSKKTYADIYRYLNNGKVLKRYGLNYWNFKKSIDKLVKLNYLSKNSIQGCYYFKLSIKGIEYLEDMLNEKR